MSVTSWSPADNWRGCLTSSTRGYAFQFSTTTGTVPVLLGFMLKPDKVTEVFHQTIEETLNSRLLNGEGEYSVFTSTISYLTLENKIQLETSHIRREYPSSLDKGSKKWIERPPLRSVEKKAVELFIWDGKGFLKHTM
ncbi:MAG: hypothetical protein M0D55_18835 [Elusimicrobiota bacterium]|nr:MAG: hypothetical protein M0D55_18835 [Elusimicrobiota bacterium]